MNLQHDMKEFMDWEMCDLSKYVSIDTEKVQPYSGKRVYVKTGNSLC